MKHSRAIRIKEELLKSFAIRGTIEKVPKLEDLEFQASSIDEKLNPKIEAKHIELLFDISRVKSWNPALTELEKAYLTDRFKTEFPRKAFVSDNLYLPPMPSDKQQEEFKKNREKLKFNWRK